MLEKKWDKENSCRERQRTGDATGGNLNALIVREEIEDTRREKTHRKK